MLKSPGPYCALLGISEDILLHHDFTRLPRVPQESCTNGLILELNRFYSLKNRQKDLNLTPSSLSEWIVNLSPVGNASRSLEEIFDCVQSLHSKRDTFRKKKQYAEIDALEKELFDVNTCVCTEVEPDSSERKASNFMIYEERKATKFLNKLENQIEITKIKLEELKDKDGHFDPDNVRKRDARAMRNRTELTNVKKDLKKTNTKLQKRKHHEMEQAEQIQDLELRVNELDGSQKLHEVQGQLDLAKEKKVAAQKSASYYRSQLEKERSGEKDNEVIASLRRQLKEKNDEIRYLHDQLALEREHMTKFKMSDGTYSDSLRFCITQVGGLEVATEKISPVILTVANTLFDAKLSSSDLPNPTTVQSIMDEGHYIAKRFIAAKLDEADNWGINKDGTTRKKKKLIDTSVTLSSGDIMSVGFRRVARETGVTICKMTQDSVRELAAIHTERDSDRTEEDFIRESLMKLSFVMSDRAANEKTADELLENWRNEVLEGSEEVGQLHRFHCMAHVLLGFHSYSKKPLKEQDIALVNAEGQFGRAALPAFARWNDFSSALERTVRMASEVFGPVGEHTGVRDRWEAYCGSRGIKSFVSNYRDNRFNALFRASAEVVHHREQFIDVLQSVKTPNKKLKSMLADLQCPVVTTMIQGVAIMYLRVTDVYWTLVTSSSVKYLELYRYIQRLHLFLTAAEDNPEMLLQTDVILWEDVQVSPAVTAMADKVLHLQFEDKKDLFLATVKLVCTAMKATIEKQLVDFLPSGKYSEPSAEIELIRTGFAHVHNLGCEHHFGDLDSSQRRRPNASLFHHSSIQMLKRNRKGISKWVESMSDDQEKKLFADARKHGPRMRKSHRQQELDVERSVNEEMLNKRQNNSKQIQKKPKKAAKFPIDDELLQEEEEQERENLQNELARLLPKDVSLTVGQYVIAAFQEGWYPGKLSFHVLCFFIFIL